MFTEYTEKRKHTQTDIKKGFQNIANPIMSSYYRECGKNLPVYYSS